MFEKAASQYFNLRTFVGGSDDLSAGRIFGLGCHVGPGLVLSAEHVIDHVAKPTAQFGDELWTCSVAARWPARDMILLKAEQRIKSMPRSGITIGAFPEIVESLPGVGAQLGCMAWLNLADENGRRRGRTYFGQGHVAYFEESDRGELIFALQGPTIERGFSGGPVFNASGQLVGVIIQSMQHARSMGDIAIQVSSMLLFSPVAKIAAEIREIARSVS